MSNFLYKTRGMSNPKGKPKVYFTCHPEDFDRYFEKICEDIFKTHDCAIYYTEDMNADLSNENNRVDMERMNLFVIPVTFRLLLQSNRAMDSDFKFAMEKHIPVLPMMMEPGIDEFYSKPDKFGELQYIDPFNRDITAISYEEKLKKYLEAVLISDELAQRVRKAFDAYIFLSYRKKDRAYANELMKLIHNNPECRDIAIWFDEFLTLGESFKENIDKMLNNSELFTLLVTPNLLEKPDGKPNFVMKEEYPKARKARKDILPAEMEQTDKEGLSSSFKEIPECVDAKNDIEFRERLLKSLKKAAITENKDDPEHNYLIGLAYLEGIDVETDYEYGVKLITDAAKHELPEAMKRLVIIYESGHGKEIDLTIALYWQQKLVNYYEKLVNADRCDILELPPLYEKLAELYSIQDMEDCAREYHLRAIELYDIALTRELTLPSLYNYLQIAKKLITSTIGQGKIIISKNQAQKTIEKIDSLGTVIFLNDIEDIQTASIYHSLSFVYKVLGDFQSELLYLQKAMRIYENYDLDNSNKKNLANVYVDTAQYYLDIDSNLDESESYYCKAQEIYFQLEEEKSLGCEIVDIINKILICYQQLIYNYTVANRPQDVVEAYQKAIRIAEKQDDTFNIYFDKELAKLYNDYGLFFKSYGYIKEAKELFLSAIEICYKHIDNNPLGYNVVLSQFYFNYALCVSGFLQKPYLKKAYELAKLYPLVPECKNIVLSLANYEF